MLKVIIADDEINVCRLIKNLVDWQSFDMEIVATAHNGVEALELITACRPDLIITDIRMPGLDGLELIQKAKELKPGLEFVIISGYRHFEYAQNAIRFGVSDYLAKPIRKAELTETLEKIRGKLLTQRNQLTADELQKTRAQGDMDNLRGSLLLSLVTNQSALFSDLTLESANREYCYHFFEGPFQAFVVKMDHQLEGYHPEIEVFIQNMKKILKNNLRECCFDAEVALHDDTLYGILNYDEESRSKVRKQLKASLEEILLRRSIISSLDVTLCLGCPVDIQLLPSSLKTAAKNVHQRLLLGTGTLIDEKSSEDEQPSELYSLLGTFTKQLQEALELLSEEAAASSVKTLRDNLSQLELHDGQKLYNTVLEAHNIFLILLHSQGLSEAETTEEKSSFREKARRTGSLEGLFQLLSTSLVTRISSISDNKKQADAKPIRTAKGYIKEHYATPLTLENVASVVGFNPSYLSSLFKKETGTNFQEYVTKIRMDKAKDLLRETDKSVSSICSEVGYSDVKHFTKGFKKHTGLSPNEFRKIYA